MNREAQSYEPLTSENAALVLVDHQVGLMTGVRDYSTGELKHNVVALAKAAKEAGNFALSRNKKPSCGGSIGGTGAPRGGSLISDPTDSPLSGAKAAMYTRAETFGWFPASVITAPP